MMTSWLLLPKAHSDANQTTRGEGLKHSPIHRLLCHSGGRLQSDKVRFLMRQRPVNVIVFGFERNHSGETTNLSFSEWTQVFANPRLCKAMVDRVTDRAHIIDTGKQSYRFRRTLEARRKKARAGGRGENHE